MKQENLRRLLLFLDSKGFRMTILMLLLVALVTSCMLLSGCQSSEQEQFAGLQVEIGQYEQKVAELPPAESIIQQYLVFEVKSHLAIAQKAAQMHEQEKNERNQNMLRMRIKTNLTSCFNGLMAYGNRVSKK